MKEKIEEVKKEVKDMTPEEMTAELTNLEMTPPRWEQYSDDERREFLEEVRAGKIDKEKLFAKGDRSWLDDEEEKN